MEGKGGFFVLLIIVAILTLTIAALAGYVFLVGGPTQKTIVEVPVNTTVPQYTEADLTEIEVLDGKSFINLKKSDPNKIEVIQVGVKVKAVIKGKKAEEVKKKIESYEGEFAEIVANYFLSKTVEDVSKLEEKEKAKEFFKKEFNKVISENSTTKEKGDVIYQIVLHPWLFQ